MIVEYAQATNIYEAIDIATEFYYRTFRCTGCSPEYSEEKLKYLKDNFKVGNILHFTFLDSTNTWYDPEYNITRGRKEYELRVKVI